MRNALVDRPSRIRNACGCAIPYIFVILRQRSAWFGGPVWIGRKDGIVCLLVRYPRQIVERLLRKGFAPVIQILFAGGAIVFV